MHGPSSKDSAPVPRRRPATAVPPSYGQQRLWFIDRLHGGSPEYNALIAWRLQGALDVDALRAALTAIVSRHESLRTRFAEVDGVPMQLVDPAREMPLPVEDLTGDAEATQRDRIDAFVQHERLTSFDLAQGPVLRATLLRLSSLQHLLTVTVHHIAWDGWSRSVFTRELQTVYADCRAGRPHRLRPLPVQYADYATWQRRRIEAGELADALVYWREQLKGVPPRSGLPTDRPRAAQQTRATQVCHAILKAEQLAALKGMSQQQHVTMYMSLLAACAILLAHYSGQRDLVMLSPVANRERPELEDLIGLFVNMLPMRVRVQRGDSVAALLQQVRRTTLDAFRHQNVPFERLVEEAGVPRQPDGSPTFQIVFVLQNTPWQPPQLDGLRVETVDSTPQRARFELEIHAREQERRLHLSAIFRSDLFDRWRIEQLLRHYARVLAQMAANPDAALRQLRLLTDDECQQLVDPT